MDGIRGSNARIADISNITDLVLGQSLVVEDGEEGVLGAIEADMVDSGAGHEVEHGLDR